MSGSSGGGRRKGPATRAALAGLLGLWATLGAAERFPVGWTQVEVPRPDGSSFAAYVAYPAVRKGADAAVDDRAAPYPAVTFGHGFLAPPLLYAGTLAGLASHGYVVMATQSQLNLFPSHPDYALDLRHCLSFLEQADETAGSRWYGVVDRDGFGAAGHSLGGGAAILAAAADERIRAVVVLAPAVTRPVSSVEKVSEIEAPLRIVAGLQDALTPFAVHALPHFARSTPPSQMVLLPEGTHCGFLDVPIPPPFCDAGAGDAVAQRQRAQRLMVEFFELHLRGDETAWWRVWGPGATAPPDAYTLPRPGVLMKPALQIRQPGTGEGIEFQLAVSHDRPEATAVRLRGWEGMRETAIVPEKTPVIPPGESVTIRATVWPAPRRFAGSRVIVVGGLPADGAGEGTFVRVVVVSRGRGTAVP